MPDARRQGRTNRTGSGRRRRASTGGFTLIEMLVAGMILAMAVAVIATAVSHSYGSLADARDERRASTLMDDLLTKVDLIGPNRIATEGPHSGKFDGADERFSWSLDVSNRPQGHLYEITATVTWPAAAGKSRSVNVTTYLNDPPNSRDTTLKWRDL
jgi:type II secretory pathway pseudopilin PulG